MRPFDGKIAENAGAITGCTPQEIAAITGHSLQYVGQILDKYLSRTRTLAENAITKLNARVQTRNVLQNDLQNGCKMHCLKSG